MTTTAPLPTLAVFHAWLVAQPRMRSIGTRLVDSGCPLAAWLWSISGAEVRVDDETIQIGDRSHETPDDYRHVIQAIDYCSYAHGTGSSVTVEECLWILREMVGEEGA